jgi:hypothetical protein
MRIEKILEDEKGRAILDNGMIIGKKIAYIRFVIIGENKVFITSKNVITYEKYLSMYSFLSLCFKEPCSRNDLFASIRLADSS